MPFYALMPEVGNSMDRVFFDSAASPYLYRSRIYQHVSKLVGSDHILFGSDYPLIAQSRFLKEIDSLELSEDDKNLILSGNARRLLGMDNIRG